MLDASHEGSAMFDEMWNAEQDAKLRAAIVAGQGFEGAAEATGRSIPACKVRACTLGMPTPRAVEEKLRRGNEAILDLDATSCAFPIGLPGTFDFRYCCERKQPGSSYCAAHHRLAYKPSNKVKPQDTTKHRGPPKSPRALHSLWGIVE
jgi:hypothetical protein